MSRIRGSRGRVRKRSGVGGGGVGWPGPGARACPPLCPLSQPRPPPMFSYPGRGAWRGRRGRCCFSSSFSASSSASLPPGSPAAPPVSATGTGQGGTGGVAPSPCRYLGLVGPGTGKGHTRFPASPGGAQPVRVVVRGTPGTTGGRAGVLCPGCWNGDWVLGAVSRVLGAFPAAGAKGNSRFLLAVDLWKEPGVLPRPGLGLQPAQQLNLVPLALDPHRGTPGTSSPSLPPSLLWCPGSSTPLCEEPLPLSSSVP